jgi:hypothetical protein
MTQEFRQSIEKLYETFSVYPFKSTMEGCPCCVSNSDKEKIHSKHLTQLDRDDLSRYAFKAMTTWGDVEDFKHYLPRIFEITATTNFIVDTFVVLGKLEYGKWRFWPQTEQMAIEKFLLEWWTNEATNKPYFDKEIYFEILKLTKNVDALLDRWIIDIHGQSFLKYVDFVYEHYNDLTNKRSDFKELDESPRTKMITWTRLNSSKLEEAFFYYDERDKELAEKISKTLYIIERTI